MLRLRVSGSANQVEELVMTLSETHGVAEIVRLPVEGRPGRFLLMADVTPAGADRVTTLIDTLERGVEDLVLATIPASAYLGVSFGLGEPTKAWGALLVLIVNVTLLLLSGTLTLAVQTRLAASSQATT